MGFYILTRSESEERMIPKKENLARKEGQKETYKNRVSVGRLFFGLFFLVIGFAFLARNLGWVTGFYVDLEYLSRFWPIFIIILGLSFLSKESRIGTILSVIFVLVIIIILAISLFFPNPNWYLEIWNLVSR
jgi:hypothetical protein